jgi:beta-lactamase class C
MKKKFKYGVLLVTLCLQIPAYAYNEEKINALAQRFMQHNQVPGMSIAVIDQNKIHFYNLGWADPLKKIPTSKQTIYTVGSFTKIFTATLAARAAVEKKLNLNAAFITYFPELRQNSHLKSITLNELLTHTSDFPFDFKPRPKNFAELTQALQHYRTSKIPGTEYSYSNAGIGIVGYVLQNIYHQNYQTILRTKVFIPLQMHSTYLQIPAVKEKYLAVGHDAKNNVVAYNKNLETWFAAASLKSSISDLANYLYAQINPETLGDKNLSKAINLVHQNRACFADKLSCEQLAWQAHRLSVIKTSIGDTYFIAFDKEGFPKFYNKKISTNNNLGKPIFVDKTGSGYGMSSYMAYIPEQKIAIVILTNKFLGNERIKLGRDILQNL